MKRKHQLKFGLILGNKKIGHEIHHDVAIKEGLTDILKKEAEFYKQIGPDSKYINL